MNQTDLGGKFKLIGTSLELTRMGYGAMQLAGPRASGPPRDPAAAIAVLRELVEAGVNHIDTSAYYGPHTTNKIIKQALHPYPPGLAIASKTAPLRVDGKVVSAFSRQQLIDDVHSNLRDLGLDTIELFNLRVGPPICPPDFSIEEPLTILAELQSQGLIRHLGLSNVTARQFHAGQKIANIVCVQNQYNLAARGDDASIDELARAGVAYVPFLPLRGFSPSQWASLEAVAASVHATPRQVALAWLLQRSPNILLIPGTTSVDHLRENFEATTLQLPSDAIQNLELIYKSE